MMSVFYLMCIILAAWLHARLTVVHVIFKTDTCIHMLNRMSMNTIWWSMATLILYLTVSWGVWVLLFCTMRFAFLIRINWTSVCDQHAEIKKLVT